MRLGELVTILEGMDPSLICKAVRGNDGTPHHLGRIHSYRYWPKDLAIGKYVSYSYYKRYGEEEEAELFEDFEDGKTVESSGDNDDDDEEPITVTTLLALLNKAKGKFLTGYKGGGCLIQNHTYVWLANWGESCGYFLEKVTVKDDTCLFLAPHTCYDYDRLSPQECRWKGIVNPCPDFDLFQLVRSEP